MTDAHVRSDTGPFAMAPEWLIFSATDRAVKLFLVLHRFEGAGGIYPSRRLLVERLGCSLSSLDRAIAELCSRGALEVINRWRTVEGDVVESEGRPEPKAEMTSNRYILHFVRQGALAIDVPAEGVSSATTLGVVSDDDTGGASPETRPWRQECAEGGVTGDALIEIPLNEIPSNENQIPLPQRALRLVDPGEVPEPLEPEPPGPHQLAVAATIEHLQAERAVSVALLELRTSVAVEVLTPNGVQSAIAAWSEHLTLEDVHRIQREASDARREDRGGDWNWIRSVCARVAGDRRDQRDPWVERKPRPPRDFRAGPKPLRPDTPADVAVRAALVESEFPEGMTIAEMREARLERTARAAREAAEVPS